MYLPLQTGLLPSDVSCASNMTGLGPRNALSSSMALTALANLHRNATHITNARSFSSGPVFAVNRKRYREFNLCELRPILEKNERKEIGAARAHAFVFAAIAKQPALPFQWRL